MVNIPVQFGHGVRAFDQPVESGDLRPRTPTLTFDSASALAPLLRSGRATCVDQAPRWTTLVPARVARLGVISHVGRDEVVDGKVSHDLVESLRPPQVGLC